MGADLCGVIMVGPRDFDPEDIKKAVAYVNHLCRLHDETVTRLESAYETGHNDEVLAEIEVELEEGNRLQELDEMMSATQFDDIVEFLEREPLPNGCEDGSDFVALFIKMWNGLYRDSMMRPVVDPRTGEVDQDFRIFVAGERTWGDGPDDDSAWGVCTKATELGILDILGIH